MTTKKASVSLAFSSEGSAKPMLHKNRRATCLYDKCAKPILRFVTFVEFCRFSEQKQKSFTLYFFVDVFATNIQKNIKASPFIFYVFIYFSISQI